MRLRASIRARELGDGALGLADSATGLELALTDDAARLVRQLLATGDAQAAGAGPEVAAFFEHLGAIGLCEGVPEGEIQRRQAGFVLEQARQREHPRVRITLARAVHTSSFHRARLQKELAALVSPADFEKLPLMTKDDLRAQFPEGLVDVAAMKEGLDRGHLLFATTSGTTGERLQVVSDARLPRFPPDFLTAWDVGAFAPGETPRTAVFTSPVCAGPVCHLGKAPMEERIVQGATLYLNSSDDVFALDEELLANVLDELARFKPHFLFVNPVYLAVLLERAREIGRALPPLRAIISCYQYLSHCQRQLFARALGCPVYDLYSATDLGGGVIANACREGGLHVRLDQAWVEVLGEDGAAGVGELGRICVTTHHPVLPLVRYLVGDLGRWEPAVCSCRVGNEAPRLLVEGRARDLLRLGGRPVTPREVDEALRGVEGMLAYQLVETAPGRFELTVVPTGGRVEGAGEGAGLALAPLLGAAPAVRLARRLRAERGQKFRLTVPLAPPGAG